MNKVILFFKKLWAYIKIIIPFTKITIKNIKAVISVIKEEHNKK